ncbi:MAG: hypothetical protein AB7U29_17055 [Desulfobulbus sp.]
MERVGFEQIFKKIKLIAGGSSQREVAAKLGISPQAISDAKRKNRIPESWYTIVYEKFGVTREALHNQNDGQSTKIVQLFKNGQPANKQDGTTGSHAQVSDARVYDQLMNEFFDLVKQWQAEENGRNPRTAIDFIQEFPARFVEMQMWQRKKEKGRLFKFDRQKSGECLVKGS